MSACSTKIPTYWAIKAYYMPNIRPRLKGVADIDRGTYRPMYYASYNISHTHNVTSLLRMLKYHTCDFLFRGLLWLLLSVLALSLDVYPHLLLCPCSVLAVSLLCFSCVLRDLWPSVAQQVTAFSSRTLIEGSWVWAKRKRWEFAERFQKVPSPEIEKAKHGYIPVNTKR